MFLTDDPTAVSVLPTPGAAGTPGYFTDGNAGTGVPATVLRADFMNMVALELQNVVTAAGLTPSKTTFNQVLTAIQALAAKQSLIGAMRNGCMAIATASASGTFTADEVVVESALGGLAYKIASYNKTINLSTTGAGGMDTGSAPASGYVAIYAIYNPTTGTASILAQDTTSIVAPEVYGGSNMPSGYTASALISVWRTNSSRLFVVGTQRDRLIAFPDVQAFTINNDVYTSISGTLSLTGVAPKNAYSLFGNLAMSSLGSTTVFGFGFTGVNKVGISGYASYQSAPFSDLILASPQTLSYGVGVGSSPVNVTLYVDGYKF